jgi:predicted protein tyrosine phosphatase
MRRVLFICGKGRQRSPTAEQIFSSMPDLETSLAGLGADADVVVSTEQIEWSTDIAVMDRRQLARLRRMFPKLVSSKRIVSLDVPDDFSFMQDELVALLRADRTCGLSLPVAEEVWHQTAG